MQPAHLQSLKANIICTQGGIVMCLTGMDTTGGKVLLHDGFL